jgi:hypothetical protein
MRGTNPPRNGPTRAEAGPAQVMPPRRDAGTAGIGIQAAPLSPVGPPYALSPPRRVQPPVLRTELDALEQPMGPPQPSVGHRRLTAEGQIVLRQGDGNASRLEAGAGLFRGSASEGRMARHSGDRRSMAQGRDRSLGHVRDVHGRWSPWSGPITRRAPTGPRARPGAERSGPLRRRARASHASLPRLFRNRMIRTSDADDRGDSPARMPSRRVVEPSYLPRRPRPHARTRSQVVRYGRAAADPPAPEVDASPRHRTPRPSLDREPPPAQDGRGQRPIGSRPHHACRPGCQVRRQPGAWGRRRTELDAGEIDPKTSWHRGDGPAQRRRRARVLGKGI